MAESTSEDKGWEVAQGVLIGLGGLLLFVLKRPGPWVLIALVGWLAGASTSGLILAGIGFAVVEGFALYADHRGGWFGSVFAFRLVSPDKWKGRVDVSALQGDKEALRLHKALVRAWSTAWEHAQIVRTYQDRSGNTHQEFPAMRSVAREGRGLVYEVQVPEGYSSAQMVGALPVVHLDGRQVVETRPGTQYHRHVSLTVVVPAWSQMGGTFTPEVRTNLPAAGQTAPDGEQKWW